MDLAPEFLNSIAMLDQKTLSWAQSMSDELVGELQSVSATNKSGYLTSRISQFVAELHEKKKDLVQMDHRIRRVYDQIRPSPDTGITHSQIADEKLRALGILTTLSKKLDNILFGWESILYAVENRHVSWKEAYTTNSDNLTVLTGLTEKSVAPVGSTIQKQYSIKQSDATYSANLLPQANLRTKDTALLASSIDSKKVDLESTARLGISNGQWAIIAALGFGVVILYCMLCSLVFKVLLP